MASHLIPREELGRHALTGPCACDPLAVWIRYRGWGRWAARHRELAAGEAQR